MKNVKSFLTAIVFSLAGVAVHANAATENHRCESGICFQLTPLAGRGALPVLAADGSSRTLQGMQVAADGSSRTPQGMQVAENGSSRTPQGMQLDNQVQNA